MIVPNGVMRQRSTTVTRLQTAPWGSPVFSVIRIASGRFQEFFRGSGRTSPEDLLHAARVLLWVRWFGLSAAFVEIHYRVEYGSLSHILNTFYCLGFLAANGYVQYLIRRRGTVKPAWLFGLSALDLAAISFSASLSGGFNSPYFPCCTTSRWRCSPTCLPHPGWSCPGPPWWSAVYSVLSFAVEPGLDLAGKEEQQPVLPGGGPVRRRPPPSASSPAWSGRAGGGGWSGSGNCSASASRSRRPSTTPPPSGPT